MSSRRRSIIKFLPEARNSSAFWSKILGKDLFYVAYARNLRGNLHVKSKDLKVQNSIFSFNPTTLKYFL